MKQTLWTRNFTIITLGTLISAIGGVAMGLALSFVVFDQTSSTWLSGLFSAASILPGITLPLLLSPVIDRCNRKRLIVGLDYLSGVLYLLFGLCIRRTGFQYGLYMLFNFCIGCIGSIYGLTYDCWYPDLIPPGMEQKGYSVTSLIYPLTTTLVTPIAAMVYERWGIELLIFTEGILLLTAATLEGFIQWTPTGSAPSSASWTTRIRSYATDLAAGFRYLKKEPGIRNIYTYMAITNASGNANNLMAMAHFQSSNGLTTTMYSLLTSAETIGRTLGAAIHYLFHIPQKHRYKLTVQVYMLYEIFDGILLYVAFPVMLVLRFACGFLGVNTATLRQAAVQSYLPSDLRGRVNGLFSVIVSLGMLVIRLLAGALGEWLPYRVVALLMASATFCCILWFIVRNRKDVQRIYEYERPASS